LFLNNIFAKKIILIMCGICGIYDNKLSFDSKQQLIDLMLSKQHHRGPDGSFSWHSEHGIFLGHNRLKIIDLSEQANQPMVRDNLTITYNGEIYNYLEIKEILLRRGYQFTTTSDTEVILIAYQEWAEKCVEHFVGMWAFAIWDNNKKTLFCSRDRFGIKPFYYIHENNSFYFSSEYKPLKETSVFENELNREQFQRGLLLGWMSYEDETFYKNIKLIPPATNLLFSEGKITLNRYWDLSRSKTISYVDDDKYFVFYEMFKESINIHMRSDVNVGGCLSGGLDSSSIASMICKNHPQVNFKTFSIYYEGKGNVDERYFINEVVQKYKNISPIYYTPENEALEDAFEKAMYHAEIPIGDSSYLSQYFLMQLASQNDVRVLIDGQGADEYLAGYMHSFYRLIADKMKNLNFLSALKLMSAQSKRQDFSFSDTLKLFLKSMLSLTKSENALYRFEYKYMKNKLSSSEKCDYELFNLPQFDNDKLHSFLYNLIFYTSLPTLLHYIDRNSMTFSLESRVPFLDHRLVEFIFALPAHEKINIKAETKAILRHSLKDILPAEVYNRKDKKGFVTPGETQWLRGPLKKIMEIDYERINCIDRTKMKQLVKDFENGKNQNAKLIWKAVIAHHWLKTNNLHY